MMGASGTLAHDAVGSGPAVVFIHAFPLNRRMWDPQVDRLRQETRVMVVDLPVFGQSRPISPASKPYGGDRRHGGRHHPAEEAQPIATNVPKGRFVPIASAGHLKNLEAPDEFTAVVRGLLQKVPPP